MLQNVSWYDPHLSIDMNCSRKLVDSAYPGFENTEKSTASPALGAADADLLLLSMSDSFLVAAALLFDAFSCSWPLFTMSQSIAIRNDSFGS